MPDIRAFNVLRTADFRTQGLTVVARIVGASHVITYTTAEGGQFTEAFACIQIEGQDGHPYPEIRGTPMKFGFGAWQLSFTALEVSARETEARIAQMEAEPFRLDYYFPCHQAGDPIARTAIAINETSGGGIRVQTLHSYPQHGRTVFTVSQLERM